jgi:hypothetical protein
MENRMSQTTITLDGEGVQTLQDFDLEISVYAKINISPMAAQRQVTGWVVSEVGNMLMGGKPRLVVSQPTVWRVPILISSSDQGFLGEVATIDVDAATGQLLLTADTIEEVLAHAQAFISPTSTTTE